MPPREMNVAMVKNLLSLFPHMNVSMCEEKGDD